MPELTQAEVDALEALVDRHTLTVVVDALADIAHAKSSHIRENWQDNTTASVWAEAADVLAGKAAAIATRRI